MTEIYIFDCDGVIINSGADIAAAVNATFQHFGYWPVPEETLISFVGDGARALLIRALKYSTKNHFDETKSKKLDEILDWYLQYYYAHPVEKTTLYAGIKKFLRTLKEKNKKVAMLTNKPGKIAHEILAKFDILRYFDLIIAPETTDDNGEKIRQKPSPDGLSFALKKLNEKYGTSFVPENVIMVGDSKIDIQAGKAFGCRTVACRGGLGNTKELLAENADFCFSVASELEKFIDILSERDVEQTNLQKFAVKNEVPIMQDEGSDFICEYIVKNNARNILEIGTAIGYSAIKFARLRDNIRVTTIEIDGDRFLAAERNIAEAGLSQRITLIHGDALEQSINGEFDVIFIDAAKAQYIKFFEKFKQNLAEDGAIISDNLSFHGMVEDLSLTHNYSTIKLVKKIRKYIAFLKSNDEFSTDFFSVGDGV
ncbi:MAG: HAD hydrolase-like protein, partial [Treponema sp.]|nr:HAD hydrolase-like protein [Treponema sp.]